MDETLEQQSLKQKKIAFAQSPHLEAVIALLRDVSHNQKLVGETEYETLVNAITMDAQAQMILDLISSVDFIKQGGLHKPE